MRLLGGLLLGVAAFGAAFGCTSILGIDGDYSLAPALRNLDDSGDSADATVSDAAAADAGREVETYLALAAGSAHTCGLVPGGGVRCWGAGFDDGGPPMEGGTILAHPTNVVGFGAPPIALAAGGNHTCALLRTGGVQCWGDNDNGELGDGTLTPRAAPTSVQGFHDTIVSLATGPHHSCAVLESSKSVVCWGNNADMELGDGTTIMHPAPVAVQGVPSGKALAVAVGEFHSCVLLTDGAVWCWGATGEGQTGITQAMPTPPILVGMVPNATAISAGSAHTCALYGVSGGIACWGRNNYGQANGGMPSASTPPTLVGLPDSMGAAAVFAGGDSACAIGKSAERPMFCWGANTFGQLALGAEAGPSSDPAATLLSGISTIALGAAHGCATSGPDRHAYCWGDNMFGQLGDGDTMNTNRPVLVGAR
jgi:alpha-tubulin suppressor-like RCC1 family protein